MRNIFAMLAVALVTAAGPSLPFEKVEERRRKTDKPLKSRVKQSDAAISAAHAKRNRRADKLRALEGK